MNTSLTKEDLLERVRAECDRIGKREFAYRLGVSNQFLNDVLGGRCSISDKIAGGVGYKRHQPEVVFVPLEETDG